MASAPTAASRSSRRGRCPSPAALPLLLAVGCSSATGVPDSGLVLLDVGTRVEAPEAGTPPDARDAAAMDVAAGPADKPELPAPGGMDAAAGPADTGTVAADAGRLTDGGAATDGSARADGGAPDSGVCPVLIGNDVCSTCLKHRCCSELVSCAGDPGCAAEYTACYVPCTQTMPPSVCLTECLQSAAGIPLRDTGHARCETECP